jgi:hypothetical protein
MSTFLDENLEDVYEPKVSDDDTEAHLRIVSAVLGAKKDDADAKRIEVTFTDPSDPEFKDFTKYFSLVENSDPKKANTQKKVRRDFYACFGIDFSRGGVDIDEMIGHEGWVVLGLDDDPEFGRKNFIKRFQPRH